MAYLKTIASLLLSGLLLVASTGIVLQKHYCQGDLKGVSLFSEVKTCSEKMEPHQPTCHEMAATPACHQSETPDTHNGCCENDTEYFQSDDYTQPAQLLLDHSGPWVVLFAHTLPNDLLTTDPDPAHGSYLVLHPPDLVPDLTVNHQVFRL